ncbi:hypothetical protein [Streptomyces sp. NPDC093260]|uniref:hypothetical protein n=1 Tax=Streptomyces sp. NPDC093260 TaxID=3155073 RepID=UPI0034468C91
MDAVTPDPGPGRFHLIAYTEGRPVVHGWWNDRAVADQKFAGWVGEYGGLPDPRIVLVDEESWREPGGR